MVRSQEIGLSRPELGDDAVLFDNNSPFSEDRQGVNEVTSLNEFSLRDEGWISPLDCIYTSSQGSSNTSTGASHSDKSNSQANASEPLSDDGNAGGALGISHSIPFTDTDVQEDSIVENLDYVEGRKEMEDRKGGNISDSLNYDPSERLQGLSLSNEGTVTCSDTRHLMEKEITKEVTSLDGRNEASILNQVKGLGGNHDDPSHMDSVDRIARGKSRIYLVRYQCDIYREKKTPILGGSPIQDLES